MSNRLQRIKSTAKRLKHETFAHYLAARDPRKLVIAEVVGYALSPIDLIPDFIPILGYLDDLLLLPLGIYPALKLIPAAVLADARHAAQKAHASLTASRAAALVIILLWAMGAVVAAMLALRYFNAD